MAKDKKSRLPMSGADKYDTPRSVMGGRPATLGAQTPTIGPSQPTTFAPSPAPVDAMSRRGAMPTPPPAPTQGLPEERRANLTRLFDYGQTINTRQQGLLDQKKGLSPEAQEIRGIRRERDLFARAGQAPTAVLSPQQNQENKAQLDRDTIAILESQYASAPEDQRPAIAAQLDKVRQRAAGKTTAEMLAGSVGPGASAFGAMPTPDALVEGRQRAVNATAGQERYREVDALARDSAGQEAFRLRDAREREEAFQREMAEANRNIARGAATRAVDVATRGTPEDRLTEANAAALERQLTREADIGDVEGKIRRTQSEQELGQVQSGFGEQTANEARDAIQRLMGGFSDLESGLFVGGAFGGAENFAADAEQVLNLAMTLQSMADAGPGAAAQAAQIARSVRLPAAGEGGYSQGAARGTPLDAALSPLITGLIRRIPTNVRNRELVIDRLNRAKQIIDRLAGTSQ